jgi:hypothetical protein
MHRFRLLTLVACSVAVMLVMSATFSWAQSFTVPDRRPGKPVMQYEAQQNVGYPDKLYRDDDNPGAEITETDCRWCHGASTAERHHNTQYALVENCILNVGGCHEVDTPPEVEPTRDCKLCHTDDASAYPTFFATWGNLGYPHHTTASAESGVCTDCHTNIVETYTQPPENYPPTSITPSPASCENCHWWDAPEPNATISAPGAIDHWGDVGLMHRDKVLLGFDQTDLPNEGTHHGTKGLVYAGGNNQCYFCHWNQPEDTYDTNPYTGYAIRYCENCHTEDTLHAIAEHVQGRGGECAPEPYDDFGLDWIGGTGDTFEGNDMFDPGETYTDVSGNATWDVQYCPQYIGANQRCFGCHGDGVPDLEDIPGAGPAITQLDYSISEASAGVGTFGSKFQVIEILGTDFGEQLAGDVVEIKGIGACSTVWFNLPIYGGIWTDTRILGRIPVESQLDGCTCRVRITKAAIPEINYLGGTSFTAGISVNRHPMINYMEPFLDENSNSTWDPDGTTTHERAFAQWGDWVTVNGTGFGVSRTATIYPLTADQYNREAYVELYASADTYRATRYQNWSNTAFQFRLQDLYDVNTGQQITQKEQLYETDWEVKVIQDYNTDDNSSTWYFDVDDTNHVDGIRGEIDSGDISHYKEISEPMNALFPAKLYVYTHGTPQIFVIRPRRGPKGTRIRLIGEHFGTDLWDSVIHYKSRAGTDKILDKNNRTTRIKLWSNTKVVFRAVKFPIGGGVPFKRITVWVDVPDLVETTPIPQYGSSNQVEFKLTP